MPDTPVLFTRLAPKRRTQSLRLNTSSDLQTHLYRGLVSATKPAPSSTHRKDMSQLTRSASSTLTETPSAIVPAPEPSTTASLSTTPVPTSQESEDQQATATTSTTALEADECASATANYDPQEDMHVTSSTLTSATDFHPLSTSTTEDVTSSTDHSRAAPTSSHRKAASLSAGTKAAPALTREQPDTRTPSQAGDYTLYRFIETGPRATVTTKETPQPSTTTAKSPSASAATETPTPTIRAEEASWRLTPKLILSPDGRFYQLIDAKSNPTCGCSFLMSDGHKCGEVNVWGGRCNYHVGRKTRCRRLASTWTHLTHGTRLLTRNQERHADAASSCPTATYATRRTSEGGGAMIT